MKIFILLTLLALTGCVGTVKDLAVEDSQIFSKFDGTFNGVVYGKAVSHSKVQLFFNPATGGSGEFSYVVYLDGNFNNSIAALAASDVQINSEGYATMLVPGLPSSGKTYSFTVRAVDLATGEQDTNTKTVTVTTFDDVHPDFNGILKVENISGIAGQTQLKVSWNKAKAGAVAGGGFGGNPYDISSYVIYFATSEQNVFNENISTINDPNQTQFTITGLNPNTTYYFAVRARDIQTPAKIEQNEIIKSAKTRSNQPIIFAGLTSATIPTNIFGYNQFIANWSHGTGSFDRYKIFFTTDPNLVIDPQTHPSGQTVTITDLTAAPTAEVFVPSPNTKYRVAMAACSDNACTEHAGSDVVLEVTTSPPVAAFNGITGISPGEGSSLVDTMQLSWNPPDLTTGAYDGIRLYLVDGGVNTLLPVPAGAFVSTGPSGTGATIRGLVEGSTYCFLAKAYVNDPNYPATPSYAGGREDSNTNVRCLTLQYQQPVFLGVNSTCTNIGTNTFRVSWNAASGVFDSYSLYYRIGNSSQFLWSEALAGHPDYTMVTVNATQTSYFIPNLNPGQTYSVGVKTIFNHPNGVDIYRSNSNATASCTTNENRLKSNGWFNIMALGPKVDGISGNKVFESVADVGGKINGGGFDLTTNFPTIVETTEIRPAVAPAQGTNASNRGVVHLTWNDFVYESGDRFCGAECTSLGANDGYFVYRMAYNQATHGSSSPQRNDANWVLLNSGNPVKSKIIAGTSIQYQASFTDYAFDIKPANEARVFWYKVEPVIAGTIAPMLSQSNPAAIYEDYVIKVILPPDNMGFVHRWIANLQTCDKLQRPVDRKNQYRCLYNGLGASTYNVSGTPTHFFDFAGHNLVDRYEMSCNFTRATDPVKKCPSGSFFLGEECISVGTMGVSPNPISGHIAWPSTFNLMPKPSAAGVGAIMYNTRGLTVGAFGSSNNRIHDRFFPNSVILSQDSTGVFEPTTCNYFNGSNWVPLHDIAIKSTEDSSLTSMAQTFSSNKAGMPPLSTMTQAQHLSLCKGYDVSLNLNSTTLTGNKRLPRRAEQVIFSDWSPNVTNEIASNLEAGNSDLACLNQHNGLDVNELSTNPRGRSTEYAGESALVLFANNRYPGMAANSHLIYKTGSEGQNSSTLCQSRYGLKDTIGNMAEWAIDRAICTANDKCDFGQVSLDIKTLKNYFNPTDSTYLTYNHLDTGDDFGIPLEFHNANNAVTNPWFGGIGLQMSTFDNGLTKGVSRFMNPILGLPLACSGSKCNGGSDDNLRVSPRTPSIAPEAAVPNFNIRGDNFIVSRIPENEEQGIIYGAFPVTGRSSIFPTSLYLNRRGGQSSGVYAGLLAPSLTLNPGVGARCAIKVNENETGGFQATSPATLFE
ncbi:MAG: fibronectin type III domain-containing protein [Bacteriovoracaceae bacterium]